jgi:hypothetical protein
MTSPRILKCLSFLLVALLLATAGCGGGVGTGGTGTYAAGPITGFGSVIVNGVRFDDSTAAVLDDSGATRPSSALQLGMTVEVDAGAVTTGASGAAAQARVIRFASEIVGPVQSVDPVARTLVVLGQTVRVGVATVFDDRLGGRGLAALEPGRLVEVYGSDDAASGGLEATRIEPVDVAVSWHLRGRITSVDGVARTLRIGGATFAFGGAGSVPALLSPGMPVRLQLSTAADGAGRFTVLAFGTAVRTLDDRDDARIRGRVTAIGSATRFDVDRLPVDTQGLAAVAGLAVGARVEARGALVGGVLRATEVKLESDSDVEARGFDFDGTLEALDTAARTFRLRGTTISYARPDLRYDDGTVADLAPGRRVEVRAQLSADRRVVEALRIRFR